MKTLILLNSLVFTFSISGIFLIFLFTPLLTWIVNLIKGKKTFQYSTSHPSVSMITVVHNAEDLIVDKIKNFLSLNFPSNDYEIIIFSDGSTDETEKMVKPFIDKKVYFFSSPIHEGKINGMNKSVQSCSGETIVFSDVDAILESDAIINLVNYLSDPEIGGVCGKRIIYGNSKKLQKAQSDYISFDSAIKKLESQIGSMSSNDGKLFSIKKDLYQPIPPGVTDDLYTCLAVVKQNKRFLFEPEAKAFIKVPSRSPAHEIERRRRVVTGSLRGIYLMKEVLNPFKYGIFSLNLFINKIIRRFLPVFLFLLFSSSLFLSFYNLFIKTFFFFQIAFYSLAFSYWALFQHISSLKLARRGSSTAYYFCLGCYGTLLGLLDFLMGKQIVKWKPLKTDKQISGK